MRGQLLSIKCDKRSTNLIFFNSCHNNVTRGQLLEKQFRKMLQGVNNFSSINFCENIHKKVCHETNTKNFKVSNSFLICNLKLTHKIWILNNLQMVNHIWQIRTTFKVAGFPCTLKFCKGNWKYFSKCPREQWKYISRSTCSQKS